MEMDMTLIAKTYMERMTLIREIAEKHAFKAKLAGKSAKVRAVARPKKEKEFSDRDENQNHYTDAPAYAKTYYGAAYESTKNYENDWGNY